MVDGEALLDIIYYNHFTLRELAAVMQLRPRDLRVKIRSGIFESNELEMLLHVLKFPIGVDPFEIFFDTYSRRDYKPIKYDGQDFDLEDENLET